MCSFVPNLVTSLEFQPIRGATTLFHFGRTRNSYVATRFILLSSTVESSATSGYVVARERPGQSEAWAGRNVERTKESLVLFPTVDVIDAVCNHMKTWTFVAIIPTSSYVFHFFPMHFINFLLWKNLSSFVYVIFYCVGAWITTLMSISDGSDPYFFPSKDGKDAVHEGRHGRKGAFFPQNLAFFPL